MSGGYRAVRLATNEMGQIRDLYSSSQNVLILNSQRFVTFWANMTHFWPESDIPDVWRCDLRRVRKCLQVFFFVSKFGKNNLKIVTSGVLCESYKAVGWTVCVATIERTHITPHTRVLVTLSGLSLQAKQNQINIKLSKKNIPRLEEGKFAMDTIFTYSASQNAPETSSEKVQHLCQMIIGWIL